MTNIIHSIVSLPVIYDLIQYLSGLDKKITWIKNLLPANGKYSVIDIGAGTGNFLKALPPNAEYIWLDPDPQKLLGFKTKYPKNIGIICDGCNIGLVEKSIEYSLCIQTSHHLDDDALNKLFSELSRITKVELIFFDAVLIPNSLFNKLLWKYDRGSNPRLSDNIIAIASKQFAITSIEKKKFLHNFVIIVGKPKEMYQPVSSTTTR